MKTLRHYLSGLLALSLLVFATSNPSFASPPVPGVVPTYVFQGFAPATAASTFNTTSYVDLPGATVTLTPTHNDPTTAGKSALATPQADLIKVTWHLDVTKATTTTGTCGVFANGALIAASTRTIDVAAKETGMSGTYIVANSTVGAQTVKLQCKSGDTAVLTVNLGMLVVEEIVF